MKKLKKIIKNNTKSLIAFILGLLISGGIAVYAAVVIQSSDVGYTNNGQSTVQGALDDLYIKSKLENRSSNFVEAYTYNASTCVTGNESTCVATTCYKTKSANSCPAGTIIRYKVRPGEVITFHVMYDAASTITMQTQKNTVYNTSWVTMDDFVAAGGTENDYGNYGNNSKGPLTILTALENATAGWINVNDQTYTAGTTTFKTNAYTGCDSYNTCAKNRYTLSSRTVKARIITVQEAAVLGCTNASNSCPIWMNNYLISSALAGGSVEADYSHGPKGTSNQGYWTMNARSSGSGYSYNAWYMSFLGNIDRDSIKNTYYGARAVVQVSKP